MESGNLNYFCSLVNKASQHVPWMAPVYRPGDSLIYNGAFAQRQELICSSEGFIRITFKRNMQ